MLCAVNIPLNMDVLFVFAPNYPQYIMMKKKKKKMMMTMPAFIPQCSVKGGVGEGNYSCCQKERLPNKTGNK